MSQFNFWIGKDEMGGWIAPDSVPPVHILKDVHSRISMINFRIDLTLKFSQVVDRQVS
jgi:hypothetical protein